MRTACLPPECKMFLTKIKAYVTKGKCKKLIKDNVTISCGKVENVSNRISHA